jgi:hypothetical protein
MKLLGKHTRKWKLGQRLQHNTEICLKVTDCDRDTELSHHSAR